MKIETILAFLAVTVYGDVLNVDMTASQTVNVSVQFDSTNFDFPLRQYAYRVFSFHPSPSSKKDVIRMTVGLAQSNESSQTVLIPFTPGFNDWSLKFERVYFYIRAKYRKEEATPVVDNDSKDQAVPIDSLVVPADNARKSNTKTIMVIGIGLFLCFCLVVDGVWLCIFQGRRFFTRYLYVRELLVAASGQMLNVPLIRRAMLALPAPPVCLQLTAKENHTETSNNTAILNNTETSNHTAASTVTMIMEQSV